uniref:RAD9-HUS1-RAD1 interacting nuclear orphan 1 n=1 Tax=Crocodylus porosus TaxID=8502 RepID=A0A7M4F5M6_CROPO
MPPKKKRTHKSKKPELLFLERPREGSVHHYGSSLPLAENPRCVPTRPVDQNASTEWVSPQFETTLLIGFKGKEGKKQKHVTKNFQIQEKSYGFLQGGGAGQKLAVCRFPSLTFENPRTSTCICPGHSKTNAKGCRAQPKTGSATKASNPKSFQERTSQSPIQELEIFSPPDIQTPELSSVRSIGQSGTVSPVNTFPLYAHSDVNVCADRLESLDSTSLVKDTPEHQYGVKVTWRQRPHLMKYLREKGRLSNSDIMVKMSQY